MFRSRFPSSKIKVTAVPSLDVPAPRRLDPLGHFGQVLQRELDRPARRGWSSESADYNVRRISKLNPQQALHLLILPLFPSTTPSTFRSRYTGYILPHLTSFGRKKK